MPVASSYQMGLDDVVIFERQIGTYQDINLTTKDILGLLKSVMSGSGGPSGDLVEP